MEECNCFKSNINLYNICIGNTNLPKWKVNAYRKKLGLSLLYIDEEENISETREQKSSMVLNYNNIGYGVGTELLYIFKKYDVPPCQACFNLAKQMNIWGPEQCLQKMNLIIEDIFPRAKNWINENKSWAVALLPNALEEFAIKIAIENKVKQAIQNFKNNLNIKETMKIDRKCSCGK